MEKTNHKRWLAGLMACLVPALLCARGEVTLTGLRSLDDNAGGWTIERVVLSDTATVVDFSVEDKPYSWFSMTSGAYLSDEKARRYALKGAVGLVLDERFRMPKSGKAEFRLIFEPMPQDTRIFDLIEGKDASMRRWYGLHDGGYEPEFPVAMGAILSKRKVERMFRKGPAVVRGKIEHYRSEWGYGFVTAFVSQLGERPEQRPAALIQADGTFWLDLELDHPVWGTVSLGRGGLDIPVFVRPGDTLDVVVNPYGKAGFRAAYKSSHPEGCHENLLRCDVPPVSAGWERMGEIWRTLSDAEWMAMTHETMERGLRLCDYGAWKYGLSDWETHLLKTRQELNTVYNQTVLANWMLTARYGNNPPTEEMREDFYSNNDYSLYGVLNRLAADDPALSFQGGFTALLENMRNMKPLMDARQQTFFFPSLSDVQMAHKEDSLQIEALRGIMGFKRLPYLVQGFLANKVRYYAGSFSSPAEHVEATRQTAAYLTDAYLKRKVWEVDSVASHPLPETYRLEGEARGILERMVEKYEGKIVQVEWLSPDDDGFHWVCNRLANLIPDFHDHPDLRFLFLFDAYTCTREEFEKFVGTYLKGEDCCWLDYRDAGILRWTFRNSYRGHQFTLNRKGEVYRTPLYTSDETQFRRSLRELLEKE